MLLCFSLAPTTQRQENVDDIRHGLTKDERKQIFWEIVEAEDKAIYEADKQIPLDLLDPNYNPKDVERNAELKLELEQKYKAQLRDKYEMTEEVQTAIIREGVIVDIYGRRDVNLELRF